jgi:AGCS family alanine or glycine:cation symporter
MIITTMTLTTLKQIDNLVWGPVMLALLLGTGIYLTIRLKGLPLKKLKTALRLSVEAEDQAGGIKNSDSGVPPLSSLMTELAATIGTGNIVGVASAILLGGCGALFWMVVSALIGMATKLVESMLAVKYRTVNSDGEYAGGPMYTMKRGIKCKPLGRLLGFLFATFAVGASFGMGNMTQANSISQSFMTAFDIEPAKTGLIITILTILIVLGGIKSISKVTIVLVPFMGIFYMLASFVIILTHWYNLPKAIIGIVGMAFCPKAFAGGIFGSLTNIGIKDAVRWGVSRGVFSNEAGLGAAGISAASAKTNEPVRQGLISMTGVFLDTVVICTVTGLAVICSGVLENNDIKNGTELINAAFTGTFGNAGNYFAAVATALFAFATIAGWEYQGEKAFEYLFPAKKCIMGYRFTYALVSFVGAVAGLDAVWTFSDICNGLMAVPNLICVLLMSGEAVRDINNYFTDKSF